MWRWYAPGYSRVTRRPFHPFMRVSGTTETKPPANRWVGRNDRGAARARCGTGPARYLTTAFLLEIGQAARLVSIYEGRLVSVTPGPFVMPSSAFALRASEEEWGKFW